MPGRDGTGPLGQGAMSGKSLGPCAGGMPTGFGRGMGLGIGFRNGCKGTFRRNFEGRFSGMTEQEVLFEQKELLARRLEVIEKQIQNMQEAEK